MKKLFFLTFANLYDNLQIGDIILPNEFITKKCIVYKICQQKKYMIDFPFHKSYYIYPIMYFGHFFWINKDEYISCNWRILR